MKQRYGTDRTSNWIAEMCDEGERLARSMAGLLAGQRCSWWSKKQARRQLESGL